MVRDVEEGDGLANRTRWHSFLQLDHAQGEGSLSQWRQLVLSEILNEGQCQEVARILNQHADPIDAVPELKKYLRQFQGQLQEAGVLPEYLAYAIVYGATQR